MLSLRFSEIAIRDMRGSESPHRKMKRYPHFASRNFLL